MTIVGITGGIGSGKTTVCRIFEVLNIPVYDADKMAKHLMYTDVKLKAAIKKLLGTAAYHSNGRPNRAEIAKKIFSDKKLLEGINALVHPAVNKDAKAWSAKQNSPYVLKEAALLVENNSYKKLDFLITVTAPEKMRIERVMKRDGVTLEMVKRRISNQLPESEKVKVSDFVIVNDGKHSLTQQVWDIHRKIVAASKGQSLV